MVMEDGKKKSYTLGAKLQVLGELRQPICQQINEDLCSRSLAFNQIYGTNKLIFFLNQ